MNRISRWLTTPIPWTHWWDPRSGWRGGVITGLLVWSVLVLVHFIAEALQ
jgi:hypothetical protein